VPELRPAFDSHGAKSSSSLARLRVNPSGRLKRYGSSSHREATRKWLFATIDKLKTDWVKFDTGYSVSTLERSEQSVLDTFGIRQGVSESAGVADDRNRSHTAYGDYTEADRLRAGPMCAALSHGRPALAIVDEVYSVWHGEMPNFLVTIAMVLALGGLAIADIVERRADRALSDQVLVGSLTERWSTFAVLVAFLALYSVSMFPPSPYNEQVRQRSHSSMGTLISMRLTASSSTPQVGAYSYALHPPLPAILLMPFTAIWGYGHESDRVFRAGWRDRCGARMDTPGSSERAPESAECG